MGCRQLARIKVSASGARVATNIIGIDIVHIPKKDWDDDGASCIMDFLLGPTPWTLRWCRAARVGLRDFMQGRLASFAVLDGI